MQALACQNHAKNKLYAIAQICNQPEANDDQIQQLSYKTTVMKINMIKLDTNALQLQLKQTHYTHPHKPTDRPPQAQSEKRLDTITHTYITDKHFYRIAIDKIQENNKGPFKTCYIEDIGHDIAISQAK